MTTPVVNAQPLVDAIQTAIESQGMAFGDSEKPSAATTRWVVGWFDAGTVDNKSLRSRDGFALTGTFHCVGLDPDAARFAVRKLRAAVLGLHLAVVDGRTVHMPENLTSVPMSRDDDADPPIWVAIDEWRFRTT